MTHNQSKTATIWLLLLSASFIWFFFLVEFQGFVIEYPIFLYLIINIHEKWYFKFHCMWDYTTQCPWIQATDKMWCQRHVLWPRLIRKKKNQQHGRDDLYHVVPDNFDFPHIYVSWRPEEKVFFCAVCGHTELCYSCSGSQSELHTAVSTEINEWEKRREKSHKA